MKPHIHNNIMYKTLPLYTCLLHLIIIYLLTILQFYVVWFVLQWSLFWARIWFSHWQDIWESSSDFNRLQESLSNYIIIEFIVELVKPTNDWPIQISQKENCVPTEKYISLWFWLLKYNTSTQSNCR